MSLYMLLNAYLRVPDGWTFFALCSLNGWVSREENGLLALTRPGPFMPPITLPEMQNRPKGYAMVVTETFKIQLEGSGLTGLSFRPVIKQHTFFMEWEKWVLTGAAPPTDIETNQPVHYFPRQPHSSEVAAALGDLWEVVLEEHADWQPYIGITNWDGTDWFLARQPPGEWVFQYVSERALAWLKETVPRWFTYH